MCTTAECFCHWILIEVALTADLRHPFSAFILEKRKRFSERGFRRGQCLAANERDTTATSLPDHHRFLQIRDQLKGSRTPKIVRVCTIIDAFGGLLGSGWPALRFSIPLRRRRSGKVCRRSHLGNTGQRLQFPEGVFQKMPAGTAQRNVLPSSQYWMRAVNLCGGRMN